MTTESKTYNGWTNYETWNVKLWMDNDQGSHRYWRDVAQKCWDDAEENARSGWTREDYATYVLEGRLKDEYTDAKNEMLERAGVASTIWADLLGAALSEVNWREIAENMMEDVDKAEEDNADD